MKATDISRVLTTAPNVDVRLYMINTWGKQELTLRNIEVNTITSSDGKASTRISINFEELNMVANESKTKTSN